MAREELCFELNVLLEIADSRALHQLPAHQRSRQGNSPCSAPTVSPHGGARSGGACPRTRRKGPTARTATAPTAAQRSKAHSSLLPQRT